MKLPLHQNERVIIKTRVHSRVLRQPFITLLILTGSFAFILGYLSRQQLPGWIAPNAGVLSWLFVLLWFLLVGIWCVAPWIGWLRSRIVLTTERILFRIPRSGGQLQSVGLYTVRDLLAHTRKKKNPAQRPGTLDVVLNHGYVRIPHVPAVTSFRRLAIEALQNMGGNNQVAGPFGTAAGEGNDR